MENGTPNALGRPALETVVEGLARSIDRRSVDPASAALHHMNNAADHAAIIDARLASGVGRQMWFKQPKLLIAEPEIFAIHEWSPSETRESQSRRQRNPFYGSGP